MQQENFALYLKQVRKVSDTTLGHYFESMRKITAVLREMGYPDIESLYDIDSYSQLQEIKLALKENPEFVALDERGHRMYSAGLNRYMEFAEGKEFLTHPSSLSLIDCPCPVKHPTILKQTAAHSRDRIMVRQVFQATNYHCEIDQNHATFISQSLQNQYVEGHHLIPLEVQDEIDTSLDVYANIIALCPTCHRFLHFGLKDEKDKVLEHIFDTRQDRLCDSGIRLGRKEFLELVKPTRAYAG
jgi:5-methylcytosine-specific restriction protein A